jgi:hypothetical protein
VATLVMLTLASIIPSVISAAPTLQASGAAGVPPLYTLRDNQVVLAGSGFTPNQPLYVWIMGPKDNSTHYSGLGFTTLGTGLIPPGEALAISPNMTVGTYLLSISNSSSRDASQARAHFGIWGALKPAYQRTESLQIVGGGLFPGVSAKLSIRDAPGDYVNTATIVSGARGDFNYSWRIPQDAVTGTYTVIIDGIGIFDNAQQNFVSDSTFSLTQALLSVKVSQQPDPSYQRTEKAKIAFTLTYPDGSPVVKAKPNIQPVVLLRNQSAIASVPVVLSDASNGIWSAETKMPTNATLSSQYRFALPAMSFDDGYGNKGGPTDTLSQYFQVNNASLLISSQVNGTQIQVPFGQVSIISKISYPDGTPLTNGTVQVLVSMNSGTSALDLVYDPSLGAWRGSYSSGFGDLWRIGKWTFTIQASDTAGNSGSATFDVTAQPYLFLVLVAMVIAVALFGRWTLSRYGRKTYLRIRKAVQKLRSLSTERYHP